MMFLLKWKCTLVSQNGSGPRCTLLVSDTALSVSHFLCVCMSASADGDQAHGTVVADLQLHLFLPILRLNRHLLFISGGCPKGKLKDTGNNRASGFEKYVG